MSKIKIYNTQPVTEGAGVRLNRAFGFSEAPNLDPFLLLDDFHSDDPDDYIAGFPWHPHRGMETVSYVLKGSVRHEDSMGNNGVIGPGDVQWMTAGSGIIHSEMPEQKDGMLRGLQLWVNLPAKNKMMAPRYQEINSSQIPEVEMESGARIKVICGNIGEVSGPVKELMAETQYLDIFLPPDVKYGHYITEGITVFAYILEGSGFAGREDYKEIYSGNLVVFRDLSQVEFNTTTKNLRFLLISGKPLGEPVAWQGPIVMNTDEELRTAFREFQEGTFIK